MSVVVIEAEELRQLIREEVAKALEPVANRTGGSPKSLNVKEAAEYLGIGINKMYDLTRRRGFPAVREGNRILIPRDLLGRWLEQEAIANTGEACGS